MKFGLKEIIGKTITSVIVSRKEPPNEINSVFLVFSDDTYFEFWGSNFTGGGGVNPGGIEKAINYIGNLGAKVINIYPKNLIPETAQNHLREKAAKTRTLERIGYILECVALDYLGEAKTELLSLSNSLCSDSRFEFPIDNDIAESLKKIVSLYRNGKRGSGTGLISRISRGLWKEVMVEFS